MDRTPSPPPPYAQEQPQIQNQIQNHVTLGVPNPATASVYNSSSAPTVVEVTIGNTAIQGQARMFKSVEEKLPSFSWELFTRFGSQEAAELVDSIVARLHSTFEQPFRTLNRVSSFEYRLPSICGWGVFEVEISINWKQTGDTRITPPTTRLVWMLQADEPEAFKTHRIVLGKSGNSAATSSVPIFNTNLNTNSITSGRRATIEVVTGSEKDPKHTVVGMVIDRSGSMKSMGPEVFGGCNAYLDEQRKSDIEDGNGAHTTITFTRFDSYVETLYNGIALEAMSPITADDVKPRGATALYDAIGQTLEKTAALVNGMEKMPSVVIFILTDGKENASKRWTKASITREITRLQSAEFGWDFYFAAAGQDAMAEGSALGMDREQCLTYKKSTGKMAQAMRSSNVAFNRKKKYGRKGFSRAERVAANE